LLPFGIIFLKSLKFHPDVFPEIGRYPGSFAGLLLAFYGV